MYIKLLLTYLFLFLVCFPIQICGKCSSALDGVSIYYFPQVEGIMGRYLIARVQSSICETYYFNGSSDFEYYRLDEIPDDGRPSMEDYLKIGSSKAGIYPDLLVFKPQSSKKFNGGETLIFRIKARLCEIYNPQNGRSSFGEFKMVGDTIKVYPEYTLCIDGARINKMLLSNEDSVIRRYIIVDKNLKRIQSAETETRFKCFQYDKRYEDLLPALRRIKSTKPNTHIRIDVDEEFVGSAKYGDINGLYIGETYSEREVVASIGAPDYIHRCWDDSLRANQNISTQCNPYCRFSKSVIEFDDFGRLFGFHIRDNNLSAMTHFCEGGLKCGDIISKERLEALFGDYEITCDGNENSGIEEWRVKFDLWTFRIKCNRNIIVSMDFSL